MRLRQRAAMKKKIVGTVVAVLVAVVVLVSTRPATYRVERSAVVDARPETVFFLLSGFGAFAAWSPWQKLDGAMTTSFEGPAQGVGATLRWSGNDQAGAGSMVITATTPDRRVEQDVLFERPFASSARQSFDITPTQDQKTLLVWTMTGQNSFFSKAMQLFVSMEDLIGKDLEQGLVNFVALANATQKSREAAPLAPPPPPPASP
jgi:hypothetical protein